MTVVGNRTQGRIATSTQKRKQTYKCGEPNCSTEVATEAIRCDFCERWFHNRCSKLSIRAIALYAANKCIKWACPLCAEMIKIRNTTNAEVQTEEEKPVANITLSVNEINQQTPLKKSGEVGNEAHPPRKANSRDKEEKTARPKKERRLREQTINATERDPGGGKTKKPGLRAGTTYARAVAGTQEIEDQGTTLENICAILSRQQIELKALTEERTKLNNTLATLMRNADIALGRNRNVVIKGIAEPYMKEGRQRARGMRHHVQNLLRMVDMPPHAALKRVLRLGRWMGNREGKEYPPRPVLVEFGNARHRDQFLAAAGKISSLTQGGIVVQPDDSAAWRKTAAAPGGWTRSEYTPIIPTPRVVVSRGSNESPSQDLRNTQRTQQEGEQKADATAGHENRAEQEKGGLELNLTPPKNEHSSRD